MAFTRRHFTKVLQAGAAMTAAGFRSEVLAANGFSQSDRVMGSGSTGASMNKERFEALAGTRFRISSAPNGPSSVTLIAVEGFAPRSGSGVPNISARRPAPQVEYSFLRFSADGAELPEGTYILDHHSTGQFHLCLSPGRPGRCLAVLAHVPEGYLKTISIPRKLAKRVAPPSADAMVAPTPESAIAA